MNKLIYQLVLTSFISFASCASVNASMPQTFADVASNTSNAVVNISTTQNVEIKDLFDDLRVDVPEGSPLDHFFKEFMERDFGMQDGNGIPKKRKMSSLGSGFLIDADGYVATNYHVIKDADEITITLSNDQDKSYGAKVIGTDPRTDLALLKIEAKEKLPYLKFGNSDSAKVGDWVLAIGNPFGLGGTVTSGIISAKSRFIGGVYDELIQTDASINRGNSGGPLINMNNEVIGINSVIISTSGANIGIGFAIPSNHASNIFNQLKSGGKIVRGFLGVSIQPVTEDIAKSMGVPNIKGAIVSEIMNDSPAKAAGVKTGDIITKFDGQEITQTHKLSKLAAETQVGKVVLLDIIRDGKPMKLEVKIGKLDQKLEDESNKQNKEKSSTNSTSEIYLGMKLDQLNDKFKKKYKLDADIQGLLVSRVAAYSSAANAGIKAGDLIVAINRVKIESFKDFKKEFDSAKSSKAKNVVLLVNRDNTNRFIVVDLE